MDAQTFLQTGFSYAVVGATTNKEKYGYRVLMDLHRAELSVVGVNPKYTEIEGVLAFPLLKDLPEKPDVVVVVIPPERGLKILDEAKNAGITKLWFQPGAESEAIRLRAQQLELEVLADGSCIMVERRRISMQHKGELHW